MMRRYAAVTDQTLRRAAEAVAGNEPVSPGSPGGALTTTRRANSAVYLRGPKARR
jgi:hypothetical protein